MVFSLLITIVITCCCCTTSSFFVSAVNSNRLREFYLDNELDLSTNYHLLYFQTSAGGTNYSVCAANTISTTTLNLLCSVVGFTRVDSASYQTLSPDPNFPGGISLSSCSPNSSPQIMTNFESQCTFAATASSCSPIAINCTGARNGGEYGTWAAPYFLRLQYTYLIEHRSPFDLNWYQQCGYSSTTAGIYAICTMLDGGRVARTGTTSAISVASSSTINWGAVSCPTGAKDLNSCTIAPTTTCSASSALTIVCSQNQVGIESGNFRFRLARSTFPALEVIPASYSVTTTNWGRVCDDYFTATDASFFCSLLGFPSENPSETSTSAGTYSYNNFFLTQIGCASYYTSFDQCSYILYSGGCSSYETVTLKCPSLVYQTTGYGPVYSGGYYLRLINNTNQVQVRASSTGVWQGLCVSGSSYFSYESASMIGKYLGIGDSCSWNRNTLLDGQTYLFQDVKCYSTTDNTFGECTLSASYCSTDYFYTYALTLPKCWNYSTGLPMGNYFIRLSNDGNYRLEVRPLETNIWGTVAYRSGVNYVSLTTASYLCGMFGFSTSYATQGSTSGGSGPVFLTNLQCTGSSKNALELDCTYAASNSGYTSGTGNDLYLKCGPMTTASTTYSPSSSSRSSSDSDGTLVGIIIGSVWGGIVFIAICVSVVAACCSEDSDNDNGCCKGCCSDTETTAAPVTADATAVAAAAAATTTADTRNAPNSNDLQMRARIRNRNNNNNSNSSDEEEGISDRRCPVCAKVLKSETGRNAHLLQKHPGVPIPAHGVNHNNDNNIAAHVAMPIPPPGYAYPAPAPYNSSDNVAPPPGGYFNNLPGTAMPIYGTPMMPIGAGVYPMNHPNTNYYYGGGTAPAPYAMDPNNNNNLQGAAFAGYPLPQQQQPQVQPQLQENVAIGMPPPPLTFGPSPWIPGLGANQGSN